MTQPPSHIQLHRKSQMLELRFGDTLYHFSAEFLRVHSPSAEVQGHGPGQAVLQTGKSQVGITRLEAAGHYGLRLYFDDGHDTGIYSWVYFQQLGTQQEALWAAYEQALHEQGQSRHPDTQVLHFPPP